MPSALVAPGFLYFFGILHINIQVFVKAEKMKRKCYIMAKKTWAVNVTWMMAGTDYVDADTMEEAMAIAADPCRPLPSDREYVSNSYRVESAEEDDGEDKCEKEEDADEDCF